MTILDVNNSAKMTISKLNSSLVSKVKLKNKPIAKIILNAAKPNNLSVIIIKPDFFKLILQKTEEY